MGISVENTAADENDTGNRWPPRLVSATNKILPVRRFKHSSEPKQQWSSQAPKNVQELMSIRFRAARKLLSSAWTAAKIRSRYQSNSTPDNASFAKPTTVFYLFLLLCWSSPCLIPSLFPCSRETPLHNQATKWGKIVRGVNSRNPLISLISLAHSSERCILIGWEYGHDGLGIYLPFALHSC
jgi:hypothetical protein